MVWPEVQRAASLHRNHVVGVVVLYQDAKPPGRSGARETPDHLLIEAVDRQGAGVGCEARLDLPLDASALDLDEQLGAPCHELANRVECGQVSCLSREVAQAGPAYRGAVREHGVVVHDDYAIGGGVNVQLDAAGAALQGKFEASEGILHRQAGHAPVSDAYGIGHDRDGEGCGAVSASYLRQPAGPVRIVP